MNLPFGTGNCAKPVEVSNIADPVPGTAQYDNAIERDKSTRDITAMPWLPQLPDQWAIDLHERIVEAERRYAAPNLAKRDYEIGTATEPDQIAIVPGAGDYLFTAEHATTPYSLKDKKMRSFPDAGTGGLAAVLAEDYGIALIMRGRQTSNVPSDVNHPIKPKIRQQLGRATGFLSVHGKAPGMFVRENDRAEIHACIGLGREPSEQLIEFSHTIARIVREDLGLYVVLSNEQPAYIQHRYGTDLKRRDDGTPKISQLAATKPVESTATFANRILQEQGRAIPAFQMELTNLLCATPLDDENVKDKKSRIIGVALGYKLFEKVVELTPGYGRES